MSKKHLLVALVAVLLLAAGCTKESDITSPNGQSQSQSNKMTEWNAYTNPKLGFQMTFTDAWKGFIPVEDYISNDHASVAFCMPTTPDYSESSCEQDHYVMRLAITRFTKSKWKEVQTVIDHSRQPIAETEQYVFLHDIYEGGPEDTANGSFEFDKVLASFKLLQ